jgi:hypothetical protein
MRYNVRQVIGDIVGWFEWLLVLGVFAYFLALVAIIK